MLENIDMECLI